MDILTLFLILEKISAVHHWVWCLLWVCHTWLLLCWGTFLLYPICWEFLSWKGVALCQMLFLIFWDDHMIFSSHSIHMVYHIFWFAYVKPSLHLRDISSLVIVYESFNMLLHSACWYFEKVYIYIPQIYWHIYIYVFFFPHAASFSGFFIWIMLDLYNAFGSAPSLIFWKRLRRIGIYPSLNVW